jgi:putative MATE family efflux protein
VRNSLNRQIFSLAIPTIVGFMGIILFEAIDIFWIGKLGAKAVAGVGGASFLLWTLYALMNLTNTGTATLIAQFWGAGDRDARHQVAREASWFILLFSLVIIVVLHFCIRDLLRLMGLDPPTRQLAWDYFKVYLYGLPIIYLFNLQGQICYAHGATRLRTVIMLFALGLNIVLDPLLIFGYWGFPKMGISGAATATLFSELLGVLISIYALRRMDYIGPLRSFGRFSGHYCRRLLAIGIPSATTNMTWTIVFPLLTVVITEFGMAPLAGLNIGNRWEGFPYFFGIGLSVAISTLVGHSVGRGDLGHAKQVAIRGVVLVTIALLPVSLLFILIPERLIGLLNSDPRVIRHGAEYLRIVGYFELFLGWELVLEGVYNGLGNTRPYMWVRVPLTLSRIPLAWLLAIPLGMGAAGVWWAISLTTLLKGLVLMAVYRFQERRGTLLPGAVETPDGNPRGCDGG